MVDGHLIIITINVFMFYFIVYIKIGVWVFQRLYGYLHTACFFLVFFLKVVKHFESAKVFYKFPIITIITVI